MSSAAFLSPYNQHPTPYPPSAPEVPDHFDGSPYSKPPPPIRYLAMERELQQNGLQVFALVVSLCWFLTWLLLLICFGSSYYFLFQAKALTPVAVGHVDDLDTYDDVGGLDDDLGDGEPGDGELAESVVVEKPGVTSVTGAPGPTPTGYSLSHPRTRSFVK